MNSPNGRDRARGIAVVVTLLLFYGTLLVFTFQEADEDVWGRIAAGRLASELGQVPERDVFAYVPTRSQWVDHEWLAGRVFYEIHHIWGGTGLLLLRAALGLCTVVIVYLAARVSGAARWAVSLVLLSVWILVAQGYNTVIRAQAFSFPFFVLFFYLLERSRASRHAALLLLIPASAIWANFHGGFVTGILLALGYGFGSVLLRQWKRAAALVGLGAACFLSSLLNPYGLSYWRYLVEALWMPRPAIVEWRPVEVAGFDDLHIKTALLLIILTWVAGRKLRPHAFILLLGAALATTLHIRFAPFLGLTMAVLLPSELAAVFKEGGTAFPANLSKSLGPLSLMALLQLMLVLGLMVAWPQIHFSPTMKVPSYRYPVRAVERLKESSSVGNLAVFFNWGEYALYHLYPDFLVSVDGRYETVYPSEIVQANWDFTWGVHGGERLLEDYPADFALYPRLTGAAQWLSTSSDWKLMYEDAIASLYQRVP